MHSTGGRRVQKARESMTNKAQAVQDEMKTITTLAPWKAAVEAVAAQIQTGGTHRCDSCSVVAVHRADWARTASFASSAQRQTGGINRTMKARWNGQQSGLLLRMPRQPRLSCCQNEVVRM